MKIVIAPDSFKECLSARQVASNIALGIRKIAPNAEIYEIPISDGGEGVLEALINGVGGRRISVSVMDPLMRLIKAEYGILKDGKTAVIEMAKASGLELLKEPEKNPLITTTFGTGQLIKDALDKGCNKIIIGIGGSATNDGGVGMVRALGAKFLDDQGEEILEGGGSLGGLTTMDLSNFDDRIQNCEVIVACDVSNPLSGANGASMVYGGAGLMAFLKGQLVNGIKLILQTIKIEEFIKQADLVFTGEGKIDGQTLHGKTISGIAAMAKKHEVPVIVLTGKIGEGIDEIYNIGVSAVFSIVNQPMELKVAIDQAPVLIQDCTKNIMAAIMSCKTDL